MKLKALERRILFQLIAGAILLVGLSGATLIFLADYRQSQQALSNEESGGTFYQLRPEQSKRFLHDLQLYGGKANVFFYEITTWFEDLWQGRSLAFIIAGFSVAVSAGLFYAARKPPHSLTPPTGGEPAGGGKD